jgi:glutamate formiminotransferase
MNLTNYKSTSMAEAFLAVEREAASHGVAVLDSEVVGLVPTAALPVAGAAHLRLRGFTSNSVLETRLAACGWGRELS